MTKTGWAILIVGVLAASLLQFGNLMSDPLASWRGIISGTVVTFATTLIGMLTKLPQKVWTDEERAEKLKETV